MRELIKFCGGLFVIFGGFLCAMGVLYTFAQLSGGSGNTAIIIAIAIAISGASLALVGGGTFLIASIDARIERLTTGLSPANISSSPQVVKFDTLPAVGVSAKAGPYSQPESGNNVWHAGGKVKASQHSSGD
jgi:hypothetical protein